MSATMIFVNLPVKDLDASKAFWGKLGYSFNAQFTDENCASMVISDTIVAMLLTEARFKDFTHKAITDTSTSTEALLCLSSESRTAVDELVDAAVGAGATEPRPAQDYGTMYGRAFEDLDGHTWEIMWMDPAMIES
ncbi:VOC family protein [Streptomyces goshikiensis]|uniref:VOC family protein n=1 Tax=Streptomyces goshikiensis TaxID=1942 RepID=A0ABZ1RP16_9ACTN|nr:MULTISPECIES: VOC family protein [Streptomyces]AKL66052.1 glyoxalase [Streptomyces sp. Mg1]AYV27638.1 Glyoxalase-like domain protein [Streptomyces sp. ADI95-16]EDX22776.1 glyoxalase/bleomycin resistance protein/dioxygenase [Streptomyces sp. Mg1]MBP0934199.1 VOC family protein [Streptomyces sp. KCTC 0041BP]OKI26047.1 glyoxalase [Streptomyces sp. CB03578]